MAKWTEQYLLCGVPGSGKSYAAHALTERLAGARVEETLGVAELSVSNRVWVYDPTQQWRFDKDIEGFPLKNWEDRHDYPFVAFDDEELIEACETAHGDAESGLIVVFDETMTIEPRDFASIKRLCVVRRHREVTLIFCTQRPRTIPVPILALCTQVVVFRTHYPDDLKHLEQIVQSPALQRAPHLAMPGESTPPQHLHFDMRGGTVTGDIGNEHEYTADRGGDPVRV